MNKEGNAKEVRCACNRLLFVADDCSNLETKCPKCGKVVTINKKGEVLNLRYFKKK